MIGKKAKIISLFIIALAVSIDFSLAEAAPGDYLAVKGNRIVSNGGKIIKLHGVAMGNPYLRQSKNQRSVSDYASVKSWQANVVRLSVHPGVYLRDEKAQRTALKKEILAARQNGLYVIVDWHVIGFPNGSHKDWTQDKYKGVYYSSDLKLAEDFWKYMATEYGNDRGIIFELWNEPFDYNGRQITWSDIRPYMQSLYELIRSSGAENIVLAPGTNWSYDLRGIATRPLNGYNIGYAWHNYPKSSQCLGWDQALAGLPKRYPVFMTEWGFSMEAIDAHLSLNGVTNTYPEKLKNYIIDNNLNSIAWAWHADWQPRMLNDDWQTLTAYGRFVKAFLINVSQGRLTPNFNNAVSWSGYSATPELLKSCESYTSAFNKIPLSDSEMTDVKRINNGAYPIRRSTSSELKSSAIFEKIYKRKPRADNLSDKKAIMIMTYGVKQKRVEIDPGKEKFAGMVYYKVYGRRPLTAGEKNVLRAIAYSGAKR